jgi:hypothetical protein
VEVPCHLGINLKVSLVRWHHRWRHGSRNGCGFCLKKIVKNSETVQSAPNLAWRFLATLKLFCGGLDVTSLTMTSR